MPRPRSCLQGSADELVRQLLTSGRGQGGHQMREGPDPLINESLPRSVQPISREQMLVGWGGGVSYIPGLYDFLVLWKRRRRMSRLKLSTAGFYGTRWGTFVEICLHSTASRPNHLPPVPSHLAPSLTDTCAAPPPRPSPRRWENRYSARRAERETKTAEGTAVAAAGGGGETASD